MGAFYVKHKEKTIGTVVYDGMYQPAIGDVLNLNKAEPGEPVEIGGFRVLSVDHSAAATPINTNQVHHTAHAVIYVEPVEAGDVEIKT